MRWLFSILSISFFLPLYSQDVTLINQSEEVTFFGLDFSKLQLIGMQRDYTDTAEIVNQLFKY